MFGLVPTPMNVAPWGVVGVSRSDGPASFMDMSPLARRGGDQQWTQSCVGWGIAGAIHVLCKHRGLDFFPSPLGVYYPARKRTARGGGIVDVGCRPDDACQVVRELGLIPEARWPFDASKVDDEPPWDALDSALDWTQFRMRRIASAGEQRCQDVRRTLAAWTPIVRGTVVDERYLQWKLEDGPWSRTGAAEGRHMELVIGYQPEGPVAVSSWGDGDRIESWEHLMSDDVSDLWAAELAQ